MFPKISVYIYILVFILLSILFQPPFSIIKMSSDLRSYMKILMMMIIIMNYRKILYPFSQQIKIYWNFCCKLKVIRISYLKMNAAFWMYTIGSAYVDIIIKKQKKNWKTKNMHCSIANINIFIKSLNREFLYRLLLRDFLTLNILKDLPARIITIISFYNKTFLITFNKFNSILDIKIYKEEISS